MRYIVFLVICYFSSVHCMDKEPPPLLKRSTLERSTTYANLTGQIEQTGDTPPPLRRQQSVPNYQSHLAPPPQLHVIGRAFIEQEAKRITSPNDKGLE